MGGVIGVTCGELFEYHTINPTHFSFQRRYKHVLVLIQSLMHLRTHRSTYSRNVQECIKLALPTT